MSGPWHGKTVELITKEEVIRRLLLKVLEADIKTLERLMEEAFLNNATTWVIASQAFIDKENL